MRVLIVEDEVFSANYLQETLQELGYEIVAIVEDAKSAYKAVQLHKPDVVLMDIMLKGSISGTEIAVKISDHFPDTIIIFLTAYSDKEMIDHALRSKAFAYLLKPYRIEEIDATMKLACNHLQNQTPPQKVHLLEGYSFDLQTNRLYHQGKEVALSQKMRKLLAILCKEPNTFVSSQRIVNYIWQEERSLDLLRSLVYRLKKLTSNTIIESSIKKGYRVKTKDSSK